ncbi:MAG: CsgG/HfaB family protein [Mariniblastus sp.]|nr:CsgG/HfaB family protein [Mariniblastus sp.]
MRRAAGKLLSGKVLLSTLILVLFTVMAPGCGEQDRPGNGQQAVNTPGNTELPATPEPRDSSAPDQGPNVKGNGPVEAPGTEAPRKQDGKAIDYSSIVVADFDNHSQQKEFDALRLGFRDMLVTSLSKLNSVRVVERARLQEIIAEQNLAKTEFIDETTVVKLGKGISAHKIVAGSFTVLDDKIQIDVRLLSVETSEVELAESINGNKQDIFDLHGELSQKVVAGLNLQLTNLQQQEIGSGQIRNFDAFNAFSQSRLAAIRGDQELERKRLQEALQLDPQAEILLDNLKRTQRRAAMQIAKDRKAELESANEVTKMLSDRIEQYESIIAQPGRGPDYFASLLTLSACQGLLGNFKKEQALLAQFWDDFEANVPPAESTRVFREMQQHLKKQTTFFADNFWSGHAGIIFSLGKESKAYRKALLADGLIDQLHWPQYSKLWPFNETARFQFGNVKTNPQAAALINWKDSLPQGPHHYVSGLTENDVNYGDRNYRMSPSDLEILGDVLIYLAQIPDATPKMREEADSLISKYLYQVSDERDSLNSATIGRIVKSLEFIGTYAQKSRDRKKANKLVISYSSQLALMNGQQPSPAVAANPFGIANDVVSIQFLWHIPDGIGFDINSPKDKVTQELSDFIRTVSEKTLINFHYVPLANKTSNKDEGDHQVFPEMKPATPDNKLEMIKHLKGELPLRMNFGIRESKPPNMEQVLREAFKRSKGDGVIVLIIPHKEKVDSLPVDLDPLASANPQTTLVVVLHHKQKKTTKWAKLNDAQLILLQGDDDELMGDWKFSIYEK